MKKEIDLTSAMTIKEILMTRDGMSADDARSLIVDARLDLMERIEEGREDAYDICMDYFGLEPDYIFELLEGL